jgi:hypothetical protein
MRVLFITPTSNRDVDPAARALADAFTGSPVGPRSQTDTSSGVPTGWCTRTKRSALIRATFPDAVPEMVRPPSGLIVVPSLLIAHEFSRSVPPAAQAVTARVDDIAASEISSPENGS